MQGQSRWSVIALFQAFTLFMVLELSRSRSVARRAHFQAFARKLAHVLDSLVRTAKKKRLWARPPVLTPVSLQVICGSPPIAVDVEVATVVQVSVPIRTLTRKSAEVCTMCQMCVLAINYDCDAEEVRVRLYICAHHPFGSSLSDCQVEEDQKNKISTKNPLSLMCRSNSSP